MNRVIVLVIVLAAGSLESTEGAERRTRIPIEAAVEQSRVTGVVTIPAFDEFFQKSHKGQVETMSNIWKLLEFKGARLVRIEIVRPESTTVVMTYSPGSGLVAIQ